MQDPLKQGLKLGRVCLIFSQPVLIRMQDPLKQGLKPSIEAVGIIEECYSNARSTKTRIETQYEVRHPQKLRLFECKIH